MQFDQSTLIKIRNYGALKYPPGKIVVILGLTEEEKTLFFNEFNKKDSELRRYYEQGVAIGDYNIDAELAKTAEKGDTNAIIELNYRQFYQRIDHLRNELFGV
jgi:hypothetical protein